VISSCISNLLVCCSADEDTFDVNDLPKHTRPGLYQLSRQFIIFGFVYQREVVKSAQIVVAGRAAEEAAETRLAS